MTSTLFTAKKKERFSKSHIWQLQREYYNNTGIEAWSSGEVPHYITSNPVMGKTYAELVLALLRDLALKGQVEETVYLLELGAGHGRLCYHFFKHFEKYYENSSFSLPPFCYILSDFTAANVDFWKEHPRLLPYKEKGWLDYTIFDIEKDSELHLQHSNKSIKTQGLTQPLIVIANYFFDTIPQDLFLIKDQKGSNCLLSISTTLDPSNVDTATLLANLELTYDYKEIVSSAYKKDPILNKLFEDYRTQLSHSHVFIPHIGIRSIERLRKLSKNGLVLLTADKGNHFLSNLDNCPAPALATHGSFSLTVNYHAFKEYCSIQGGYALFPNHQHTSLDLGCLLFLPEVETYKETFMAYERFVMDYGPDDYFSLKKLIEKHFDTLSFQDIMGTIRLSAYDARIFIQMLPRLHELIRDITDNERWTLFQSVHRIWDTYYPLGEKNDLAFELGNLLFALSFFREAIIYFDLSIKIYGQASTSLYNIILCYCFLEDFFNANLVIEELEAFDSESEVLNELFERFATELTEPSN
jgi:hypothetical protein